MAETARQDFDTRLPLRVSPGNVTSTSLAFAGRWAGEGPAEIDVFEKPVFKSYFAAPGEYALSWHHVVKSGGPPDHRPIEVVSVATKITVEKPTGDDAVVFGLLSQN